MLFCRLYSLRRMHSNTEGRAGRTCFWSDDTAPFRDRHEMNSGTLSIANFFCYPHSSGTRILSRSRLSLPALEPASTLPAKITGFGAPAFRMPIFSFTSYITIHFYSSIRVHPGRFPENASRIGPTCLTLSEPVPRRQKKSLAATSPTINTWYTT